MQRALAFVFLITASLLLAPGCAGDRSRAPSPTLAEVRVVAESPDRLWTGVGVSREGRVFVNYPRWGGPYTHAVEEILPDGSRVPYPDEAWNAWRPGEDDPANAFVCVQSVHVDDANRLWVLDPAAPGFQGPVAGGAKLVRINLHSNQVERVYTFDETIAPPGSYLNDVRVETKSETAYITDSGHGAIVVLDLPSGRARRLLAQHPSTKAEHEVTPVIEGRALRQGGDPRADPPQIHSDGLALDREFGWLYYQALTSRTLYRVPTEALRDADLTPRELAKRVERLGRSVMTDGMLMDDAGNLYFSAIEENAVVYRRRDAVLITLGRDDRLAWPDSFAQGPDGSLYVTTSQIHRTPMFSAEDDWPETPYLLLRLRPAP